MPVHHGSCHCGAIAFEVEGDIAGVETCNCSICTRTGYLHWYVEPERFRLLTPAASIATYQFGTRTAKNHFCRTCGISPFRRARSDPHKVDVNVRCLAGVDLAAIEARAFDGRNWEAALAARPGQEVDSSVGRPAARAEGEREPDPGRGPASARRARAARRSRAKSPN